ncbi:uncharacterized protein DS421_2g41870 [Arachis hypogaea]|nr:uncharacterized protein DS421_2g41870 [Arachis hypogaea]
MLGTSGSHPCGFCGFQMQDVRFLAEACWRLLDLRRSFVLGAIFWFICFA